LADRDANADTLLARLDRGVAAIEAAIVGLCLITGAVLNFLLVVGRYLLDLSLSSFEEISVYLILWMTFVGLIAADRGHQHIRIDILHHVATETWRSWLERFNDFAKASIGLTLAWLSLEEVLFSYAIGERAVTALETPIWLVMAVMPPAFLLFGLRNLVRLFKPDPVAATDAGKVVE